MFAIPANRLVRYLSLLSFTFLLPAASRAAGACTPGEEACPVVLRMKPGAITVTANGFVSVKRPLFYYKFTARGGQKITIKTAGGAALKTGAGIPLSGPGVEDGAVDENVPYELPASGSYTFVIHANLMSDGPFGKFRVTLTVK